MTVSSTAIKVTLAPTKVDQIFLRANQDRSEAGVDYFDKKIALQVSTPAPPPAPRSSAAHRAVSCRFSYASLSAPRRCRSQHPPRPLAEAGAEDPDQRGHQNGAEGVHRRHRPAGPCHVQPR